MRAHAAPEAVVEKEVLPRTYLPFLHPFPRYLASDYYMLAAVQGAGNVTVNETTQSGLS